LKTEKDRKYIYRCINFGIGLIGGEDEGRLDAADTAGEQAANDVKNR
jgi:hypothetical protein